MSKFNGLIARAAVGALLLFLLPAAPAYARSKPQAQPQQQKTCFYDINYQLRARVVISPTEDKLYAVPFFVDAGEVSALQTLKGVLQKGMCVLAPAFTCVIEIDSFGHADVFNGDDGIYSTRIGHYGEEANARAAVYRFQQVGICTGLKIKKAPVAGPIELK